MVDLNSGKYWNEKIGHECYNLEKNKDGNFYGYCPPNDVIDITKLGALKDDDYIDGVSIVYVTKDCLQSAKNCTLEEVAV